MHLRIFVTTYNPAGEGWRNVGEAGPNRTLPRSGAKVGQFQRSTLCTAMSFPRSCFVPQPLQWRAGYRSGISSSLPINLQPMESVKRGPTPRFKLGFQEPMECLLVSSLPEGPEWTYEIKLDGYRAQALCDREHTRLLSRNGKDLGQRFPGLI